MKKQDKKYIIEMKIGFQKYNLEIQYWIGKTYMFQGERFASFGGLEPKVYKSKKVAERAAESIVRNCTNVYEATVVEVL